MGLEPPRVLTSVHVEKVVESEQLCQAPLAAIHCDAHVGEQSGEVGEANRLLALSVPVAAAYIAHLDEARSIHAGEGART